MSRSPFVIYLSVEGKEKHFIQFHETRQSALESGEQILKDEFPAKQGEVTSARILSGLEKYVLLAGWDPIGKTNDELLVLAVQIEYAADIKLQKELAAESSIDDLKFNIAGWKKNIEQYREAGATRIELIYWETVFLAPKQEQLDTYQARNGGRAL